MESEHDERLEHHERETSSSSGLLLYLGLALGIAMLVVVGLQIAGKLKPDASAGQVQGQALGDELVMRNYRMVDDFELTDQQGEPFGMDDLEGKVWVADFIFTSCAAECPILSYRMSQVQKRFAGNEDVHFVSISVDPQTDTPGRLANYAVRFKDGDNWTFLTGKPAEIDTLIKESFLLPVARTEGEREQIAETNFIHSEKFAIVDRLGVVRAYVDGLSDNAVDRAAEAVERLLAEPAG